MNKIFRRIHMDVSLFFLPLALMYALSGILFLCGWNQDSHAKKQSFYLHAPFLKENLPNQIKELLQSQHLPLPSNFQAQKAKGGGVMYGTPSYSVIAKDISGGIYVEVIERNWIGKMMMLHKGKAKWYFDILGFAFALALVVFYFSGLFMSGFCKNNRAKALSIVGAGLLSVLVLGYLSVV